VIPERDRSSLTAPAVFLALAAAGSAVLGLRAGFPWLLPLLNAAPAYTVMIRAVGRGRRAAAVGLMLWWAACLGASTTILCAADPWGTASVAIVHGEAYLQEMRPWLRTGEGCESDPSCFVPQHLLHATLFTALALLTAGSAAILMGAILMNYMAYYVGSLASGAVSPVLTALLGWPPWSLVRIVSFIILGTVLAEPLLHRLTARPAPPGRSVWILAAAGGLVLDVVLKFLLAPRWPGVLAGLLHG